MQMVERIARAIDPEAFQLHAKQYAYGVGLGESREQAQRAADGLFGDRVKQAMGKAVDALREMREPTEVMIAAAERAINNGGFLRAAHEALIDAAIADHGASR